MSDFTPYTPDFGRNPWPAYARLREQGLVWHEGFGMWLASRFADVVAIATDRRMLREPLFASPAERAEMQRAANFHDMPYHERFVQTSMLERDGPDHDRLRRAVFPYFTKTRVETLRGWITAYVADLVGRLLTRGQVEFIADLASDVPGQVIGHLMGVPPEDCAQMTIWSEETVSFFDPDRSAAKKTRAEAATQAFHDYLQRLRHQRIRAPKDDLISVLIAAEQAGTLSADETIGAAMQILHAGHGSTIDAMGSGLYALLTFPDQMQRLRDDPALMPKAVQEMFRFAAPLPFFHRFAGEKVELCGRVWPVGTKFGLLYAAANRDPVAFADPDRFDAGREPNRHIAFGAGAHMCLGNNLSRLNMEIVFTTLLARTRDIQLAGEPDWKQGIQAHGLTRLPISFKPGAA